MADNQRIYPVHDVEAQHRASSPLVPGNTAKSDKGEPVEDFRGARTGLFRQPTPRRGENGYHHSPPPQRTYPVMHSKPPKKRSCCCKFLCWTFTLLLILIIAIAITVGTLYLVFRPKLPKYSINELGISQFDASGNNSLSITFNVTITARNPNKKIGIYYQGGSHISAWYKDTQLCEGSLPKFYQGHRNTTRLNLPLTGQTEDASGLVNTLQQQQQETGNIPLNLKVKQPVRIKLGKLKLFKLNFRVRCKLVVDNLSANNDIKIDSNSCKFRLRL